MARAAMRNEELWGVLPVDKPEGPTSHDVVAAARRGLGTRRVGHTGTLDPFASGLLLLCIGRATRLAEYLSELPKTYVAAARLGVSTDTDDRTGAVVASSERWRELSAAEIEAAFRSQVGRILQVPPIFSAKRVGGERMYRLARRGETPEAHPVPVTVYRLEVRSLDLPVVEFEVECSSGTYIRAIARDVGETLGTGAHLIALRRTRIGVHHVAGALPMDRLGDRDAVAAALLSPLAALSHLPVVEVSEHEAVELGNGVPVTAPEGLAAGGPIAVAFENELLAVAAVEGGRLVPRKVFPRE